MNDICPRKWIPKKKPLETVTRLCKELNISSQLASLLISRGFCECAAAYKFLNPSLHDLPDPFLMAGMEQVVARLELAFCRQEKIIVFGDYDMDGIAATTILVDYLRKTGFKVDFIIPSRLTEGYGLSSNAVKQIAETGATLVVTVDCGISNFAETQLAKSLNLDLIITDHHQIPEKLPAAFAIINPHLDYCRYPDKNLAGVGVVFNLMMALRRHLRHSGLAREINLLQYLDLVALGTVADVMLLTGVNRILTSYGLIEINKANRLGLRALLEASRFPHGQEIKARDLAYRLAPRINAVGRIDDAKIAVELFLTNDKAIARQRAQFLEECNTRRRQIENDIKEEVEEILSGGEEQAEKQAIILASEKWHPGVVGIVSSRIAEDHAKPTILVALEKGVGRGSGRSVPGLNLVKALEYCQSHLLRFGGHEQAVGLAVNEEDIPALRKRMEEFLTQSDFRIKGLPDLEIDAYIEPMEINQKLLNEIEILEPLGPGNPEPIFALRKMRLLKTSSVGQSSKRHLKFAFTGKQDTRLSGIAFNFNGICPKNGDQLDLAFTAEKNIWQGKTEIRLNLIDFHFCQ